jgi:DNA helicase TIP49 (TBP-interacting protein)
MVMRRYAAQLLTPAWVWARAEGGARIGAAHVRQAHALFLDAKASARILTQHSDKFMK